MHRTYAIVVFVYCMAIAYQSHFPQPDMPTPGIPQVDKLAHGVMFGTLACLIAAGMRASERVYRPAKLFWVPATSAIAYGISDEVHQAFVPARTADPLDVLANTTGVLVALSALCMGWWRMPWPWIVPEKVAVRVRFANE